MRQTLLLILFIFSFAGISFAQVPRGISYQAIVTNSLGSIQESRDVTFRISLLEGSSMGSVVYAETHTVKTNDKGIVNLIIGRGTSVDGSFDEIVWQNGRFYAKFEVDLSAGTDYRFMGVTELLTVPFAFYAFKADTANSAGPYYKVGDHAEGGLVIATWDKGRHGWVVGLNDLSTEISWNDAILLAQADTTGGYRNWKVPTVAQLKLIYEQREAIGGLTNYGYHSSDTEGRSYQYLNNQYIEYGLYIPFYDLDDPEDNGEEDGIDKDYATSSGDGSIGIRPVREF